MKILRTVIVPTGHILVVEGWYGKLEMVSLGDYGKDVNIKCDALGLDRIPKAVKHTQLLPLEDKWVITVSTQYGCSMGCVFCDVPKVGPGQNATERDITQQVLTGLGLHPEIEYTNRLNIHYARMGEPTFNPNVLTATRWLKSSLSKKYKIHPVVSTMMPKSNQWLSIFINEWMRIKNELLEGEAGLQLSINSTNDHERASMFDANAHSLMDIGFIMDGIKPVGRKITLNFAVADWEIDPSVLLKYFSPEDYIIKLTPMHKTATAKEHNIKTFGDETTYYPYVDHEQRLKAAGYDVLVFIASEEEDASKITCGNAILAEEG